VYHAENIGAEQLSEGKTGEFRSVLFWVDKHAQSTGQVVKPAELPSATDGDAIVRTLVGCGSPVELGTPGLILDVELPKGGGFRVPVDPDFNAFVWMLEGEANVGAYGKRAGRSQIAILGPGGDMTADDTRPGTRFMPMAGKPYGEPPIYNGPYVN
jgi:redox-sensitive bicupin YhaK (pirin superfamily)